MTAYLRAFGAETLKLKRTLLIWTVFLAPAAVNLMLLLMMNDNDLSFGGFENGWLNLQFAMDPLWAILMVPLLVALQTALLGQVEHSEKSWKHLYALPIPRQAIYLSKWVISNLLLLATSIVYVAGTIFVGLFMQYVMRSCTGLDVPLPLGEMLAHALNIYLMMVLVISIQLFIGIRWNNFLVPIGVGMVAAFANIFIATSDKWYYSFFPWFLAGNTTFKPEYFAPSLLLSLVGGAAVLGFGLWQTERQS